jgi:hypothetical protein
LIGHAKAGRYDAFLYLIAMADGHAAFFVAELSALAIQIVFAVNEVAYSTRAFKVIRERDLCTGVALIVAGALLQALVGEYVAGKALHAGLGISGAVLAFVPIYTLALVIGVADGVTRRTSVRVAVVIDAAFHALATASTHNQAFKAAAAGIVTITASSQERAQQQGKTYKVSSVHYPSPFLEAFHSRATWAQLPPMQRIIRCPAIPLQKSGHCFPALTHFLFP